MALAGREQNELGPDSQGQTHAGTLPQVTGSPLGGLVEEMVSRVAPVPDSLQRTENRRVLAFLHDKSAHGDVAEVLVQAAGPLGDVQEYCPDLENFRYVVLATQEIVFAFAVGMDQIGFRLNQEYLQRALETGGRRFDDIGSDWTIFEVFRSDYPSIDLEFWARKAYVIARGPAA